VRAVTLAAAITVFTAGTSRADVEDTMVLELREEIRVNVPGATGAFSVDPTVAEVSAESGRLLVIARGVGTTTISVITATDVVVIPLRVAPLPPHDVVAQTQAASRTWTLWQSNYESSSARLMNSVEMVDGGEQRTWRAYALNALELAERPAGDRDERSSMPALALEWRTPQAELVAFDKLIEHSALTLDGMTVRGGHVRVGGLDLHAGVTSPVLYQDVFLSTRRETVLGASYEVVRGSSSLTPSVYGYPSAPQTGGTRGAVGSLMYRYRSPEDHLQLRSELGWGGELGAAADLTYQDSTQRAWINARHEPRGFAAIGGNRPLGSIIDAVWTRESQKLLDINLAGTAAHYQTGPIDQDVATTTAELRFRLPRRLVASAGASVGRFRSEPADAIYSISAPAGLHYEGKQFGMSAIYRYQANSARNRGGHGGRLAIRGTRDALRLSGFVDVQQEAATVELILKDQPVLAKLLNDLGLTASTPDDLARLLRENSALAQLGYADSATLNFNPWRAQANAELAWMPNDAAKRQLRLRVLLDRTQTVGKQQDTLSAGLSYQQRFGSAIEASAQLSWWARDELMTARTDTWSIAAALSVRIDRVPSLRARGSRVIDGVIVDPNDGQTPVAGVTVRLDGTRAAVTDRAGHFSFADVEGGDHDVAADAPANSYFVSPQRVTTRAGGSVQFHVARLHTSVSGTFRDDVGAGIMGVTIVFRSSTMSVPVTTDSNGAFRVALPAGDYVVEPQLASFPMGYDASALAASPLRVLADSPVRLRFRAPALRSLAGTIHVVAGQTATIKIVENGLVGVVDDQGRYVFRDLAPDRYTVEATIDGRHMRRVVDVPAGPASIREIDFPR
jgi:hypothetical protein